MNDSVTRVTCSLTLYIFKLYFFFCAQDGSLPFIHVISSPPHYLHNALRQLDAGSRHRQPVVVVPVRAHHVRLGRGVGHHAEAVAAVGEVPKTVVAIGAIRLWGKLRFVRFVVYSYSFYYRVRDNECPP